ncbi:hypothetical protein CC80DRAFT_572290 [Byssothecium circinans]|uniref:RING-type domain-containing protein n=1 Tax=Byssothecium circinans TaxID=147558 RepID=A0A6A5TJL2_9PLEO|nr:hypothetical protein CC80DRAFT_572290 [Byssothecium circinans]
MPSSHNGTPNPSDTMSAPPSLEAEFPIPEPITWPSNVDPHPTAPTISPIYVTLEEFFDHGTISYMPSVLEDCDICARSFITAPFQDIGPREATVQSQGSDSSATASSTPSLVTGQGEVSASVTGIKISLCHHVFCLACLKRWLEQANTCPMCRTILYGTRTHDEVLRQALQAEVEAATNLLSTIEREFDTRHTNYLTTLAEYSAASERFRDFPRSSPEDEAFPDTSEYRLTLDERVQAHIRCFIEATERKCAVEEDYNLALERMEAAEARIVSAITALYDYEQEHERPQRPPVDGAE